jgi:hypothetical protein
MQIQARWSYKDWEGVVYPQTLHGAQLLAADRAAVVSQGASSTQGVVRFLMTQDTHKIVIIGAGIAGLFCIPMKAERYDGSSIKGPSVFQGKIFKTQDRLSLRPVQRPE